LLTLWGWQTRDNSNDPAKLALSASKADRVSPRVEFDRQSLENPSVFVGCTSFVSSAFLANAGDLLLLVVVVIK
jgi:hypothetical protein